MTCWVCILATWTYHKIINFQEIWVVCVINWCSHSQGQPIWFWFCFHSLTGKREAFLLYVLISFTLTGWLIKLKDTWYTWHIFRTDWAQFTKYHCELNSLSENAPSYWGFPYCIIAGHFTDFSWRLTWVSCLAHKICIKFAIS